MCLSWIKSRKRNDPRRHGGHQEHEGFREVRDSTRGAVWLRHPRALAVRRRRQARRPAELAREVALAAEAGSEGDLDDRYRRRRERAPRRLHPEPAHVLADGDTEAAAELGGEI